MAENFEDVWRRARALFPAVPALVARDFCQDAYTRLCEYRGGGWSFLRKEASIDILAARTLSVTFTQGSTAITSAALFVASDAGRQIKVSTYPVYTIASVTDASTAVLDRAYSDVDGAATATILNAYFVCPADFRRFLVIYDPYYQRILPYWSTTDDLALTDPARTFSDSGPRFLVPQAYSTATATLGQTRYEFQPYPTSARHYPYLYYRAAERFADSTVLPGVLANRSDLLKLGAQVMAAQWPGTADLKNPYYSLSLARDLGKQWDLLVQQASNDDDSQYGEDLMLESWVRRYGGLAPTTQLLRATDATVYDYI